ncbi:MAG: ATP-dependent endonuclease [Candidatus Thorarchaeota archaeon]
MRIRRINIKNFRNIRNIEIYPTQTTVIIGENNSGKSNFLQALRLVFDPTVRRIGSEISEDDINDFARSEGEKWFSIAIEIGDLQKHQELEAIFRDRIDKDDNETFVTIEGKYERNQDGEYDWSIALLPPSGRDSDPLKLPPQTPKFVPLFYLDAVRDAKMEMRATGRGIMSQLLQKVSLEDVEDEIVENIQKANQALGRNQDIDSLAMAISDLLSSHVPGGKGKATFAVATDDPDQLVKGLRLGFRFESDYKTYDMLRHGTGLQNLVLVAMFRHNISSIQRNQGAQPILTIEEPEAHLHPQAQRCLFEDLESIKSPIFLTTHSPTIVEKTKPRSLIRLTCHEKEGVSAHQLDCAAINEGDIKNLARLMRSGFAEAFFARAVILVEGYSDKIVLSASASQMGMSLDREGISVLPVLGNSYSFVLSLFSEQNFSIPTVVTFDTDVLHINNNLVNEAAGLGLISSGLQRKGKTGPSGVRRKILEDIGWIPVIPNLEGELAQIGYLQFMQDAISTLGYAQAFEDYLTSKNLTEDANSIASFISERNKLKIPLAYIISEEIRKVGKVPNCFIQAIDKAKEVAINGGTS